MLDAVLYAFNTKHSIEDILNLYPELETDDIQRIQSHLADMNPPYQDDEPEQQSPEPQFPPSETEQSVEVDASIKSIVEAILFAANRCMTTRQIQAVFPELEQPELKQIQAAVDEITQDYQSRPVGLKKLASGYRFQVKEGMSPWISRLFEEKPPKYSRALLETLAIIAYRQPVTRGEIEDIRGVSVSSNIIRTMLDREWIRIIAHKEVPGRPALYGTTRQFLDYFNLSSLDQLPTLEEVRELDLEGDPEHFETQQQGNSEEQKTDSHNETTEESVQTFENETGEESEIIPTTLH